MMTETIDHNLYKCSNYGEGRYGMSLKGESLINHN